MRSTIAPAVLLLAAIAHGQCNTPGVEWNDGNTQAISMNTPWSATSPSGGPVEVTGPTYHGTLHVPTVDHQGRAYNLGYVMSDQEWFDCANASSTSLADVGVWHLNVFTMTLVEGSIFNWHWIQPPDATPTGYPMFTPHFGQTADVDHPKLQAVFFDPSAPAAILFSNAVGCAFTEYATSETSAEYTVTHQSNRQLGVPPVGFNGFDIPGWAAIVYPSAATTNTSQGRLEGGLSQRRTLGFRYQGVQIRTTWAVSLSGYGWRVDTNHSSTWALAWDFDDSTGPEGVRFITSTVAPGCTVYDFSSGYWDSSSTNGVCIAPPQQPPAYDWMTNEQAVFTKPFPFGALSPYADWTLQ